MESSNFISQKNIDIIEKLFKSSGEAIMFLNEEGEIELLNPRVKEMFGYDRNELLGKKVEQLVPIASQKAHVGYRKDYMLDPHPKRMGVGRDLEGLRKDGTTFPLEASLTFLEFEGKKLVVAFIIDISVRKENERTLEEQRIKLEEYTNQLEKKVRERTSELEHLNLGLQSQIQERKIAESALKESLKNLKKAEQEILQSLEKEKELSELKSRFVSMASHEFRTPLTTVLSSANLIGKYTNTDQQPARKKHIERIRKSVLNLTTILNDFLSIEKLESGSLKATFKEIDLIELLEEVIEETRLSLKTGQKINYQQGSIVMITDAQFLKNILINLISNASKYSKESQPIDIHIKQTEKCVTIHVKDHGIGIPDEEQKNMFQRFFRAGNVTNIQGTGLGLTIVKKYVDLLGGTISFDSQESIGSTFTITLPA